MKNHTAFPTLLVVSISLGALLTACMKPQDQQSAEQTPQPQITEDISLSEEIQATNTPTENSTQTEETAEQTPEAAPSETISEDTQQTPEETPPAESTSYPEESSAETVDNPQYLSWAKFGVGTRIVLENTTETDGTTQKATLTQTLTEVNPESLTYQLNINTTFNGQDMEMPGIEQTVPAKIPAGTPTRPAQVPGVKIIEEKKESLTIGQKTYKTRVTKFEIQGSDENNPFTSTATLWESDDVPGSTVRMETVTNIGGMSTKTILALKQVDTK